MWVPGEVIHTPRVTMRRGTGCRALSAAAGSDPSWAAAAAYFWHDVSLSVPQCLHVANEHPSDVGRLRRPPRTTPWVPRLTRAAPAP